jgi:hypothetical protein
VFLPIIIVQWKLISGKKRKKNKASKMSTSIISVLSWPNKATRTHALRPKLNMQNPNPRAIKGTKKTPKLPNNFQKKELMLQVHVSKLASKKPGDITSPRKIALKLHHQIHTAR